MRLMWGLVCGLLVVGCDDTDEGAPMGGSVGSEDAGDDASDAPEGDPETWVDYSQCDSPRADPECEGLDCAEDEAAREHLAVFLEEVEAAGLGEHVVADRTWTNVGTNQLLLRYQVQFQWYRTWESINMRIPETEAELRAEFAEDLAAIELPESIVRPAEVQATLSDCDPILTFDPCDDNWSGFVAHAQYDWEEDGCVPMATYAKVDLVTGELTQCVIEEEYGCDE